MKLNKYICAIGIGAVMTLPLSCSEDFLEQKDLQGATEEALFKKEADGVSLVNAIYDTFHHVDFMLKALWYQANFLSQDFKNYGADTFFERYEVKSDFAALEVFWERAYIGIGRANAAIPIIAKMREENVITQELADRLTGEALFLRGVFYYYLACNFGGVPLELKTVTDDGRHPRNTQDEVFAAVEADMKTAANLLPWKEEYPEKEMGRATKGAALAYLGDAQMWQKKYAEAVTSFEQLNGKYELETEFLRIHEFDNQNGKESIFEVQFISGPDMSWGATNDTQWITTFGMPHEVTQFGYAYADPKLYNAYHAGDERKAATVIGPGDEHPSPNIKISNYPRVKSLFGGINTLGTKDAPWKGDDGARSGYYGVKNWRDPNAIGNTGAVQTIFSGQNLIMMRYGQVLLSLAEAQFRSGNSAGALATVQKIRDRAFGKLANPSVVVPPSENTDVMKIILDEYRYELAGEFSLWFVLRRSGEHINYVMDKYGIAVPPGKDLMPIPQKMIGINQELEQNPGY
jgi:hypothetical protein